VNWAQLKKVAAFYGRFTLSFTQVGYRARSLGWATVPRDFRGQRWLVTGASSGIGATIALQAARAGAEVQVAARSAGRLDAFIQSARGLGVSGLEPRVCDFSLRSDTQRLVEELASRGEPLDVLVNNVGVLNDAHSLTAEGHESSFAINLLSHFVLTEGLIERGVLRGPAPLVINMTSGGGYNVPLSTALLDVRDPAKFNGTVAYAFHKRAQMVLNQYWRDTWRARGIAFYVMHPGWADTDGVKRSLPRFRQILKSILRDGESAADTALWLAAARPPQREEESVWFDRRQRTAHVYARTRVTRDTPQSLVEALRALAA
jgi:dehydrogenase/reductase SDR family member 12